LGGGGDTGGPAGAENYPVATKWWASTQSPFYSNQAHRAPRASRGETNGSPASQVHESGPAQCAPATSPRPRPQSNRPGGYERATLHKTPRVGPQIARISRSTAPRRPAPPRASRRRTPRPRPPDPPPQRPAKRVSVEETLGRMLISRIVRLCGWRRIRGRF